MNAIISTLLDLDAEIGPQAGLLVAGGLGLYLKQQYLVRQGIPTLVPDLPVARTTQDIDWLMSEQQFVACTNSGGAKAALIKLGFEVDKDARWMKYRRMLGSEEVILDVMLAPPLPIGISVSGERAKPKHLSEFHARFTPDAIGAREFAAPIPLQGTRSSGASHACEVLIPCALTYATMKLLAFHDRLEDSRKDLGRHHAFDLYRIFAMLTEDDEHRSAQALAKHVTDRKLEEARQVARECFCSATSLGVLRLREHPLCPTGISPSKLAAFMQDNLSQVLGTPRASV